MAKIVCSIKKAEIVEKLHATILQFSGGTICTIAYLLLFSY